MTKNYLDHPLIIKAKELSDVIIQSEAFKEKDIGELQSIIIECNQIIMEIAKINYGAICQPRSGCCG